MTLQRLIICCTAFISLHVTVIYAVDPVKRIVLLGDSIIDNAYWNEVKEKNTGQRLVELFNDSGGVQGSNGDKMLVDDRSIEEATTTTILSALIGNGRMTIPGHDHFTNDYVGRRDRNDVAYDSGSRRSARLAEYCEINARRTSGTVNITRDIKDSYVFISVGGNDLLLNATCPETIFDNLKKIIEILKALGALKVIVIFPYNMPYGDWSVLRDDFFTNNMLNILKDSFLFNLRSLILNAFRFAAWVFAWYYVKGRYVDEIVDLSDFDDRHRVAEVAIPEPTIRGASLLAHRIRDMTLRLESERLSSVREEQLSPDQDVEAGLGARGILPSMNFKGGY